MRIARRLLTFGLLATALARSAVASPQLKEETPVPPEATKPTDAPLPIFVNAPADREVFWKMWTKPDFVILDGNLYRRLLQAGEPAKPAPSAVIESLEASGEVVGDWARLTVEYRVAMATDGPAWVPIHLNGLTLSEAREEARDLPTRMVEGNAWEIEIRGKGDHVVRVALLVPVRSTVEGRRLDLPTPPVASTRIDLKIPQTVLDASTGINEMVAIGALDGYPGARLATRLSPRSRIELSWRERTESAVKLPTLLSAHGDIAIEVERGSIKTQSSWVVGSVRGTANQLVVRLDPAEVVIEVEVDKHPVSFESGREGGRAVVTIPLSEPLRPNTTRAMTLTTRRPIASSGTVRVGLQGYPFDQAKVQTGMIAVSRSGPLFLNPTPDRGLRRIDPRTELSEALRARPDTALAFEFNDQPFELGLNIEPAPPRLQVETRSTITIEPQFARLLTRLDCRTSQGRVFDVQVMLPKGLEFESAGPEEIVESTVTVPLNPKAEVGVGLDAPRLLSIKLKPQARDGEPFQIQLKGWCPIDSSGPVAIPLFKPVVDSTSGGRFAVETERNVSVELPPTLDEPSSFRVDWGLPPADWLWPSRTPGPELGVLWLRSDANPETLPLKMTVRSRSIRHDSTLSATVDRRGAEVSEEISGEVAFGTLSRLDVALPKEIPSRWDVEGAKPESLGQDPDGTRRYRLLFARDNTDLFRVRIRYRLPLPESPGAKLRLAPIRVLEGISTGHKVVVSAEPGIDVKAEAKGWVAVASPEPPSGPEAGPPVRAALDRVDEKASPVVVTVKPGPELPMPSLVVSRLWIKTVQRPENDLATSAYFWVETRDGSMVVGLPGGSTWVRARVGLTELGEGAVEVVGTDEYRLRFPPSTPTGPILVAIDWIVPASATSGGWPAPRLLGGGVIQQAVWETQVLGSRAGVGTPPGWTDENEWYWEGLLWKRRPWKNPAELTQWLSGGNSRYRLPDQLESGEPNGRHAYLFSRVGPPTPLRFAVISRFTLLLLCSGPVLLAGLLILARRPPPRLIAGLVLLVAFAVGTLVEPNVAILVVQSSALGVVLFLSALAMNRAIERRGQGGSATGERPLIVATSSLGSSLDRVPTPGTGSDDTTAIRPRPLNPSVLSTADHVVLTRPSARPPDERSTSDLDLR